MFGEGDMNTLTKMIENAQAGKNKYQVGSGENLFDWTYVANAASAHLLASEALLTATSSDKSSWPSGWPVKHSSSPMATPCRFGTSSVPLARLRVILSEKRMFGSSPKDSGLPWL
ncbi:hypothetical protein XPA_008060 [Xanthoria parietina]